MSVLRGTEKSPAMPVESPIDNECINREERKVVRRSYEERLKVYEDYTATEEGQAALALIEPERKYIDYRLMRTPRELGMSVDEAEFHKAVLIGERRVWTKLLTEPDMLKKELARLEGTGEEDNKGGPSWKKLTKKGLDKFKGSRVISQPTNVASTT